MKVKIKEVKTLSIPKGLTEKQETVYNAILRTMKGKAPSSTSAKVLKFLNGS